MRDSYLVRVYAALLQYNTQALLTKMNESCGYNPSSILTIVEDQNRRKIESKKIMRTVQGRRRKRHVNSGNADYGESANRPDIDLDSYNVLVEEHIKKLKEDQANRLELERSTVTQGDCEIWHAKRTEILTASKFGKICRRRPSTSCANLVKEILYPSVKDLPALTYGTEHEDESRNRLAKILKKNIQDAGLLIDAKVEYIGASVDGLIDGDGIIELKNPISIANLRVSEALKRNKVMRRIFSKDDINKMNPNHVFYYQVQEGLHITQRDYCIFALCTTKDIKYVRVERDDDFWETKIAGRLHDFYFECLLPEILDSRYNRNMPIRESKNFVPATKETNNEENEKVEKKEKSRKRNKDMKNNVKKRVKISSNEIASTNSGNENEQNNGSVKHHEPNHANEESIPPTHKEDTVAEQRVVLRATHVNLNFDTAMTNLLNINDMLSDETIELFMQIVKENTSEYEIHPTMYFRFYHLLPQEFVGYNGKPHLQIIGGHEDYKHWICIHFDGTNLRIYDSVMRSHPSKLHSVEKDYIRYRYPKLQPHNILLVKVTQQLDSFSCGAYAMAFVTDIILKRNPSKVNYTKNVNVMRRHASRVFNLRELHAFPFKTPCNSITKRG